MTDIHEAREAADRVRNAIAVESSAFAVSKADIATVLDALDTAERERDELREDIEYKRSVKLYADHYYEALAVIERIDREAKDFSQSDNDALSAIEHILSKVAPADALRAVKAEAWDQGHAWGWNQGSAYSKDATHQPDKNPYRNREDAPNE